MAESTEPAALKEVLEGLALSQRPNGEGGSGADEEEHRFWVSA